MPAIIVYAVLAILTTVLLARDNFGLESDREILVPFVFWLTITAGVGLVLWSVIACIFLHGLNAAVVRILWSCTYGSAFWAFFIVITYLPGYAALFAAYVRFVGKRERQAVSYSVWLVIAAMLAAPAGLALLFGYGWSGGQLNLHQGGGPALIAWFCSYMGILLGRRLVGLRFGEFAQLSLTEAA